MPSVAISYHTQHFKLRDGDCPRKKIGSRVPIPALAPQDDAGSLKGFLGLVGIAERGLTVATNRRLTLGQCPDEGFAGLVGFG
jgi:hypothetical protein